MRRFMLALALASLVVTPALAAAGASVTAPDGLTFGDSFEVEYEGPRNYTGVLAAFVSCSIGDERVYGEKQTLPATFTLGPTPSWTGGEAECLVELRATRRNGEPYTVAADTFHVDG